VVLELFLILLRKQLEGIPCIDLKNKKKLVNRVLPPIWIFLGLADFDVGLLFQTNPRTPVSPSPFGTEHQEWTKPEWVILGQEPRSFRSGFIVNDSVRQRMQCNNLQPPGLYRPQNLPS